ncbi:MAG: hypothetical protein GKR88_14895 [Flavobacteriaceae bacterium]|nr:MAG: hypothetical protein GKR88_14895 [Flavobacteriaceae bacterium]
MKLLKLETIYSGIKGVHSAHAMQHFLTLLRFAPAYKKLLLPSSASFTRSYPVFLLVLKQVQDKQKSTAASLGAAAGAKLYCVFF